MMIKQCTGCKEEYPVTKEYFYFIKKKPSSKCKSCISVSMKKYYRQLVPISPEEKKEKEKEKRLKSYKEGGTIRVMSKRAECSVPTYSKWLKENNLERPERFIQRRKYEYTEDVNVKLLMDTIVNKKVEDKDTITKIMYQIHKENRKVLMSQ